MGKPRKTNKTKKKIAYQCEVCNGTQDEPVVACDKCDKWHHFSCVGIKSIGKKDSWFCDKCKPTKNPSVPSLQSIPEDVMSRKEILTLPPRTQKEIRNENNDRCDRNNPNSRANPYDSLSQRNIFESESVERNWHKESSSKMSIVSQAANSRQDLELQMLQEERLLCGLRDVEYLKKKYSILMQRNQNRRATSISHESHSIADTRKWVEGQRSIKSVRIDSRKEDEFIKRLDALTLDNISITARNECPVKNANQSKVSRIDNLLQCEECQMIAEDENLEACLLCFKQFHFACMDVIMIDDERHYICSKCKRGNGQTSKRQTQRSIPSLAKPFVRQVQESEMQRCGTCLRNDEQERFRSCDVCRNSYHFSCMTLESIEDGFIWICNTCKQNRIRTANDVNPNQFRRMTSFFNDDFPTPPSNSTINNQPTPPSNLSITNQPTPPSNLSITNQPILPLNQLIANDSNVNENINATVNVPVTTTMTVASQPTLGASHILTSAQIASRHVVTRDLPIFTGQPEQWPMFVSRFENTTSLCGFSDAENLDRLQKCLQGNAKDAVGSRLLTAEPVPGIMATLKLLYGRPEVIVNAFLKKIRAQPSPKADQLNTVVDFALSVKNVCATLEQSALHSHLSNPALMQELVNKLPSNFKIDWARYKATKVDVTLSSLGDFLFELATVISTVTEPTLDKTENKFKKNSGRKDSNKKDKDSTNGGENSSSGHVYAHQSYRQKPTEMRSNSPVKVDTSQCRICKKTCQKVEDCPVFISYEIDRRWKEIYNHKLCRKCLGHHGRFCNQSKSCGVNGCVFKHHSLLHDEKKHSPTAIAQNQQTPIAHNNNFHLSLLRSVLLRIVPVTLYFNKRYVNTFAYQDDGSDVTMMEESLITSLKITGPSEPLCLLWTAEVHRKENNSKRIDIEISGQGEFLERFMVRDVRTVELLGLPVQTVIKEKLIKRFPYLRDIPLINYLSAVPQILIGSDNAHLNAPLEIVEGTFSQPIACKSRIGWSLHGRTDCRESISVVHNVNIHRTKCPCQITADEEIHQLVKDHFSVENFGVQFDKNLQFCSKEDERALDILKTHTRRIGDRYETALLWKYDDIRLPDSYGMAYKRLQCLENHKPDTIDVIDKTIQDYIRKGYASKLTDEDIRNSQNARIWYLPIFTVSHSKKPEKVRVVFDGAAKVNGVSLNSVLLKGPDQLSSLVDILRRYREKKVASIGDITEMFPQIKIRREDVNVQRFLWRNGDKTRKPDQYVLTSMTFGANCSPASAQYVKNTNASLFEKEYPRAVESIIKNHYVDDMLDCQDTEAEMVQLIKNVKKIHSHAGFEIRKFLSNSATVMEQVNEADGDQQPNNLDMSFGTERVLGLWWNIKKDCFTYSLKFTKIDPEIVNGNRMPTKRELLKILMSIYDPLGLLSHYLIHLKIILQDVWRSNLGWDDEISLEDIQIA